MSRGLRTVELVQAFLWTCDDCGRDNFERAVLLDPESVEGSEAAEFTDSAVAEVGEAADVLGIQVGGDWVMAPSHVRCTHCGAEFDTECAT